MAYSVDKLSTIDLGRQGENLARTVEIDVSSLLAQWPDAVISLLCKRKHDTVPYVAVTEVKDGMLIWPITSVETEAAGDGKIELRAVCGEIIAKSMTAVIRVTASLTGTETDVPDAAQGWVDQVLAAGSGVEARAIRAEEAAGQAEKSAVEAEEAVARAEEIVASVNDSVEQAQEASRLAGEEAAAAEASAEQARQIAEDVSAEAERIETAVTDAELAADKIDGMKVSAETLEAGVPATVTIADDGTVKTISFGIPKGDPGEKPVRGEDYWTAEDKEQVVSEAVAETLEQVKTISFYFCSAAEVDENGKPVISDPDDHTFYLVPSGEEEPNLFIEWVYLNEKWERFGSATIDLSGYVRNTDYASLNTPGIVRVFQNDHGLRMGSDGSVLVISSATDAEIDEKKHNYKPIVPSHLDYAVKKALADSKLADTDSAWTEDEKAAARELLGAVGVEDYATPNNGGVVRYYQKIGFQVTASGYGYIAKAETVDIDGKSDASKPIVSANLDYAVKIGLTTNALPLTDEEQASAQEWLGTGKIINDNTVANDHTWSSQHMLEKLAIPFEKSSSIVQCHPVEGSPLDIKADIRPTVHLDWTSKAGETTQVTTTGAQLFDPMTALSAHAAVASPLSTGIKLKAWGSQIVDHAWVVEHLKPSTVYYVKCRIKKTEAPGEGYTAHSLDKRLLLYSPNGAPSTSLVNWNVTCAVGEWKDFAVSFTTPAGIHDESLNYSIYGYSEYYVKQGENSSSSTIEITDLIISETDVPFESYTGGKPSPSPEYPQPLVDSVSAGSYYVRSSAPEGGYWQVDLANALGGIAEHQDTLEIDRYTGRYRLIQKTRKTVLTGGMTSSNASTDTMYSVFGAILGTDHKDYTPIMTDLMPGVDWIGTPTPVWSYWHASGSNGIIFPIELVSSVEQANSWLSERPLTLRYVLTEPIVTNGQAAHVSNSTGLSLLSTTHMNMSNPDPDHPCKITLSGGLSLMHCRKNLITYTPDTPLVDVDGRPYMGIDISFVENQTFTVSVSLREGKTIPENVYFAPMFERDGYSDFYSSWMVQDGKILRERVTCRPKESSKKKWLVVYNTKHYSSFFDAFDVQLELGETASIYEEFWGEECFVPLPEGFVGGQVGVTSGIVTNKMAYYAFTGDETLSYSGSQVAGYVTVYTAAISPAPVHTPYAKILPYCTVAKGSLGIVGAENQFALNSNTSHFLRITTGVLAGYSDTWTEAEKITGLKAYLKEQYDAGTPVTIFYEVSGTDEAATPQLISALDGVNTIYSNAQTVTVSGRESPIHTIETLTERIAALETAATST